ncbi:MAG: DUF91 domain-containing protein [Deltaproteobacteria bacterium]|nr:DUF91 domain-containing protein [Deltaproteobacteria bacterium]
MKHLLQARGTKMYSNYVFKSEAELEAFLCKSPACIESGLQYIANQVNTTRGPLDLLLVDDGGRLTVVELKNKIDDSILFQGLDYFGWIWDNIDSIKRIYKNDKIDSMQPPRLILIAPDFSNLCLSRVRFIRDDIRVQLFRFKGIAHEKATFPVFFEIKTNALSSPMSPIPTADEFGQYLTNEYLQKLFYEVREKFSALSSEILEKINQQYISLKYKGRTALTIYVTRKRMDLEHYDQESNWVTTQITEETQFDCEEFINNQRKVLEDWDAE